MEITKRFDDLFQRNDLKIKMLKKTYKRKIVQFIQYNDDSIFAFNSIWVNSIKKKAQSLDWHNRILRIFLRLIFFRKSFSINSSSYVFFCVCVLVLSSQNSIVFIFMRNYFLLNFSFFALLDEFMIFAPPIYNINKTNLWQPFFWLFLLLKGFISR